MPAQSVVRRPQHPGLPAAQARRTATQSLRQWTTADARKRFETVVGTAERPHRTGARCRLGTVVGTLKRGDRANAWLWFGTIVVATPFLHAVGDAVVDPAEHTPAITGHGHALQAPCDDQGSEKSIPIHVHSLRKCGPGRGRKEKGEVISLAANRAAADLRQRVVGREIYQVWPMREGQRRWRSRPGGIRGRDMTVDRLTAPAG
jgi:hypothetical protein